MKHHDIERKTESLLASSATQMLVYLALQQLEQAAAETTAHCQCETRSSDIDTDA